MDVTARLAIAEELVTDAGTVALAAFRGDIGAVRTKNGPHDVVTDTDERVERLIAGRLHDRFPDDGFVGEEATSERDSASGLTWTADPVDGTWNFAAGLPHWCVIIACADEDGPLVGVTFDPARDELWSAARGQGLTCNGVAVQAGDPRPLADSTWAVGLGQAFRRQVWQDVVQRIGPMRLMGSLGIDLAWTAAGRFDGLAYRCAMSPWDIWAGIVMAREQDLDIWESREDGIFAVMPQGWREELGLREPAADATG